MPSPARKKLVVANWKMNPVSPRDAQEIANGAREAASGLKNTEVVLCPPHIFLHELITCTRGRSKKLAYGAQNCFFEECGARTGEISPQMIKSSGGTYVIVGHSERRALGESNEDINKKVRSALSTGLKVILCVGEPERDVNGMYWGFLKDEIALALARVSRQKLPSLIIAYEPIWAIGKGASYAMSPHDVHEASLFIKKILKEIYKNNKVLNMPILYGGSVSSENTEDLLKNGEVDGLLVGHKSLDTEAFREILRIVDRI